MSVLQRSRPGCFTASRAGNCSILLVKFIFESATAENVALQLAILRPALCPSILAM